MIDNLLQDITIYHNNNIYNLRASVRNTMTLNRTRPIESEIDNTLIRIFDTDNYKKSWTCEKGDIIVLKKVNDIIETAPLTELRKKYGKENVVEVASKQEFIFNNTDTRILAHIKLTGR